MDTQRLLAYLAAFSDMDALFSGELPPVTGALPVSVTRQGSVSSGTGSGHFTTPLLQTLQARAPRTSVETASSNEPPAVLSSRVLQVNQQQGASQQQRLQQLQEQQQGKRARGNQKKELSDLQALVAEKQAEIQRLQLENQSLVRRAKMLEQIIHVRNEQVQRLQCFQALAHQAAMSDESRRARSSGEADSSDKPNPLVFDVNTIHMYKDMSVDQLGGLYKGTIQQITQALLYTDEFGHSKQLNDLMSGLSETVKYVSLCHPEMLGLASRPVGEEDPGAPPEDHWHKVAASLNSTEQQRADASLLFDLYRGWSAKVLAERQQLTKLLSQLCSSCQYGCVDKTSESALTEAQVMERLQKNTVQERCLIILVGEVFNYKILNMLQSAQMLVHSYPWIPDGIAMLSALVKLHDAEL